MKVVFANIYQGLLYEGKLGKQDVFSKFAPSVYLEQYAALEPDVLCLAEVPLDDGHGRSTFIEELAERMGAKSAHTAALDRSWLVEGKWYGSAMLSRYELEEYEAVPMQNPGLEVVRPNGDRWRMHEKILQSARVQVHGQKIKLFNMHYYPVGLFGRTLGEAEFEPMRQQVVDSLRVDEKTPVIVAGDFNNGDGTLEHEFPELFADGKLRSAVEFAKEDFDEFYLCDYQMDHILYTPGQLALSAGAVVRDRSDHHGIVAEIEVL